MTDSLRDQLKKLGFTSSAPAPKPQSKSHAGASDKSNKTNTANRTNKASKGRRSKPAPTTSQSASEIDLARAYAIRAQKEKQDRIDAEREKQEQARIRREARQKLEQLLKDRTLNKDDAEIARHFEYGGKIRRVYVSSEQLVAVNAGEMGVIQVRGRYVLVDGATLAEAEQIFPEAIALKVDPNATEDDAYSDPDYQVPDDLVW